jgi:hypothetical protein
MRRSMLFLVTILITRASLGQITKSGSLGETVDAPLAGRSIREEKAITVPAGFYLTSSWSGADANGKSGTAVRIYRKDYSGGQPDYVSVVDLRYATIRSFTGSLSGTSPCRSSSKRYLCSSSSTVTSCASESFWAVAGAAGTSSRVLRVLLNGTFFQTAKDPTGIAFGLRLNSAIVSYGYGIDSGDGDCATSSEYPNNTYTFRFNNSTDKAYVSAYDASQFTSSTYTDVIGALNPTCCKSPSTFQARTLVGTRDDNSDGGHETVFFFSSSYSSLTDADAILKAFGATTRGQLDGAGSTGLVAGGSQLIRTTRPLPHAIAIYSGQ